MLSGLLPVVKPVGPSSAAFLGKIKHVTRIRLAGHAGTLDPGASGVLVVAFNRATRILPYLPTDKSYRALIRLGLTTDTLDAAGTVLAQSPVPTLNEAQLEEHLQRLAGEQMQIPPQVSARHFQGKRLYDWARSGTQVEVLPSRITVYKLQLLAYTPPDLECYIECSRGTYIRSLARDLGEALGCGACLWQLMRTRCSGFTLPEALTWEQLEQVVQGQALEKIIISPAQALNHLSQRVVYGEEQRTVQHGRPIPLAAAAGHEGVAVRVLDQGGRLLAVARAQAGWLKMERVLYPANEEAA